MSLKEDIGFGIPALIILVVLAGAIISSFVINVDPGYEGVLIDKTAGGVQSQALSAGWHLKMPVTQSVEEMEIRTQKEETTADASSKDMQTVQTNVAINFRPQEGTTPKLYNTVGTDYKARIIDPCIQESVKATTARYTAEELVTKREMVKAEIGNDIKNKLASNNIILDGIYITNFKFSDDFSKAIEAKQIAQQNALKAENDLARIRIEANQTVATADAEAQAIKIKGDALKENPSLVKLEWVQKWDGKMPLYYGSGSENMLMQMPE